jgi:DNA-binding transcriptional LysR family regulator
LCVPTDHSLQGNNSIMDLRQLRYFLVVAEQLSYSKAAAVLHVSQPPVHTHVRALETEIGAKLFARTGPSIRLTAAGTELARNARLIMADLSLTLDRVRNVARARSGHLRIGVNPSVMWTPFLRTLKEFIRIEPGVTWSLSEGGSEQLHAALKAGTIDIGLWRAPLDCAGSGRHAIVERLLMDEALVCLVATSSTLAANKTIDLRQLAPCRLLTLERERSYFARRIVALCRTAGFEPRLRETPVAPETLIAMAASGHGVALVPESMADIAWPGVAVVRIAPDSPVSQVYIAHLPGGSELARDFSNYLLQHLPTPAIHAKRKH